MTTIDEIEALLARATPGPWYHHEGDIMVGPLNHGYGPKIASANYDGGPCRNEIAGFLPETVRRAALIVALRNSAPDLIAVVRAAAKVAKLDDANRPAKAWNKLDEALAKLGVGP